MYLSVTLSCTAFLSALTVKILVVIATVTSIVLLLFTLVKREVTCTSCGCISFHFRHKLLILSDILVTNRASCARHRLLEVVASDARDGILVGIFLVDLTCCDLFSSFYTSSNTFTNSILSCSLTYFGDICA